MLILPNLGFFEPQPVANGPEAAELQETTENFAAILGGISVLMQKAETALENLPQASRLAAPTQAANTQAAHSFAPPHEAAQPRETLAPQAMASTPLPCGGAPSRTPVTAAPTAPETVAHEPARFAQNTPTAERFVFVAPVEAHDVRLPVAGRSFATSADWHSAALRSGLDRLVPTNAGRTIEVVETPTVGIESGEIIPPIEDVLTLAPESESAPPAPEFGRETAPTPNRATLGDVINETPATPVKTAPEAASTETAPVKAETAPVETESAPVKAAAPEAPFETATAPVKAAPEASAPTLFQAATGPHEKIVWGAKRTALSEPDFARLRSKPQPATEVPPAPPVKTTKIDAGETPPIIVMPETENQTPPIIVQPEAENPTPPIIVHPNEKQPEEPIVVKTERRDWKPSAKPAKETSPPIIVQPETQTPPIIVQPETQTPPVVFTPKQQTPPVVVPPTEEIPTPPIVVAGPKTKPLAAPTGTGHQTTRKTAGENPTPPIIVMPETENQTPPIIVQPETEQPPVVFTPKQQTPPVVVMPQGPPPTPRRIKDPNEFELPLPAHERAVEATAKSFAEPAAPPSAEQAKYAFPNEFPRLVRVIRQNAGGQTAPAPPVAETAPVKAETAPSAPEAAPPAPPSETAAAPTGNASVTPSLKLVKELPVERESTPVKAPVAASAPRRAGGGETTPIFEMTAEAETPLAPAAAAAPVDPLTGPVEAKPAFEKTEKNAPRFDEVPGGLVRADKQTAVKPVAEVETPPVKLDQTDVAGQIEPRLVELAGAVERKEDVQIMRLRLHPAELGAVEVKLERAADGRLEAQFQTESDAARQSLTQGLERLREALEENGWQVARLEVSIGASASDGGRQSQQPPPDKPALRPESFAARREREERLGQSDERDDQTRLVNLRA